MITGANLYDRTDRLMLADAYEEAGQQEMAAGLRREAVDVRWYKSFSATDGAIRQHALSCRVPLAVGRHHCPVTDLYYAGGQSHGYVTVVVERWERGWVLTPYFPPYETDPEDFTPGYSAQDGFSYLVRDDQPTVVWTWLDFDHVGGGLTTRYQLTINDGRLVDTGCGPQINPKFRRGVNDPNEWVGPIN